MSINAQTAIAHGITASRSLVDVMCADLTEQQWLHRPTVKANPPAWVVGHLILVTRRFFTLVSENELPALPAGFEDKFPRDEAAAEKATDFGDLGHLLESFNAHQDLLAKAVLKMPDELLAKPLEKPIRMNKTVGDALVFCGVHTGMHAGQISMIRRTLGLPPVT